MWLHRSCFKTPKIRNQMTQLSGTQFDKTTTRSEYWEVVALPLFILRGHFHIRIYVCSLVVIFRNWVCDNLVYQFPSKLNIAMTSLAKEPLSRLGS